MSTESCHIRSATNADRETVQRLVFTILRSYGLRPDPATTDADLDDLERHYLHSRGWFAVLECGDRIVGCYGLAYVDDSTCELRKMYLSQQCRGRGYGKLLLDDALQKAAALGYEAVVLETASVLKEAISLYLKYGFQPREAVHLSARCDQAYVKWLGRA